MRFQEMFNSVVKGFASDEFSQDQIGSMGCEVKPPLINRNNMGFPPLMTNSFFNPVMAASQNSFSEEIESNSIESGPSDLQFGRIVGETEAQTFKPSKIVHNFSPSEVSMPLKRKRGGGFSSTTPFCKVHGCNKNLSNCKEYHRRHKVCEVHSKTSKVIFNGIEQRFCQQCSRFHLLSEFDDGKRSCRKRLAGHNERRRKPHEGNEFKGFTGAKSSCQIRNPYPKNKTNSDERLNSKSFSPCSGIASSFESAHSLLSSRFRSICHSSRDQTSKLQSYPSAFPGRHYELTQQVAQDSGPVFGLEGNLVNFGNGMFRGSKQVNSDNRIFPDEGCTIDLLELSSQLTSVEHQKFFSAGF